MPTETRTTLAPGEVKTLPITPTQAPLEILVSLDAPGNGEFRLGQKTFSVTEGGDWRLKTQAMGILVAENTGPTPLVFTTRI